MTARMVMPIEGCQAITPAGDMRRPASDIDQATPLAKHLALICRQCVTPP